MYVYMTISDRKMLSDLYRNLYRIFIAYLCMYHFRLISHLFRKYRNRRNCRRTCSIVNFGPNCPPAGLCWDLGLIFSLAAVL